MDPDEGIIAGHGRVLAAREVGLPEVPVIILAHLTDAQKRAFMIADNKLAPNAAWRSEDASPGTAGAGRSGFGTGTDRLLLAGTR